MSRRSDMSNIRLARVFTNGAVLQRGKTIRIWGFSDAKEVTVSFAGVDVKAETSSGRFDASFPEMAEGGPYEIKAVDDKGNSVVSSDIMVGDVIILSGQSNMEFTMENVRQTYPREWDAPDDKLMRNFKVTENGVFGHELEEVKTGEWKSLSPESIDAFSAIGYFAAKRLREKENVAIGLVDLTLGGAPMEAFMSRDNLCDFPEAVAEADKFSDDAYRESVQKSNETDAQGWLDELDRTDIGLRDDYKDGEKIIENGRDLAIPEFFSDTELDGFIGCVWLARRFTVPDEYAGKRALLYFGAITDFDWCYINGVQVGYTDYCYPSRRYEIPEGLIKKGENTIVLRIGVEKGFGRITPGKLYGIIYGKGVRTTDGFNEGYKGADHIEPLCGVWKYVIGTKLPRKKDTVFVNWKATALYNGMLAPLSGLGIKAFAYYQGESNCGRADEYAALTKKFVAQIRRMWGDIPYIYVQLPEFNGRMEEISNDGGKAWRALMRAQEECLSIEDAHMVKAYGYGELNDLHPQRKAPIGEAIAELLI